MIISPGPASVVLGEAIAKELGLEPQLLSHRLFPDGETYIRFPESVKGEVVVLVQTTAPNPDRKLMQLLIMARTAKDLGASRIIAVIPYLAYARQDKRFLDGEAMSFDIILDLLESAGVNDTVLIDVHNETALNKISEEHEMRIHNLTAIFYLADYLKENTYKGAYSLSPDLGRSELVEKVSKVMGGGFSFFMKVRDRYTGKTTMKVKNLDLEGRDVVIFDDIISSGGTMARAIQGLKDQGAGKVAAVCTHALPVPGANEKLKNAGADLIVATDSVESIYETVSVAKLVANFLKTI
ncbi:ribose-phosphate pyrophosphokinase [Candidatus Bathyarchaeota archaeon]|jgi:ribose-phosphate pyrophosphokinase|nr:ribose-phosphate pyrophosphokinase [Candidatus Bathyarchaeota archaeon]MBT4424841.1 ribose-phosphate pyrophosphokinase [Candidatus Bathyarchaeota archaeon]MBT6603745.1 ribose-phosphate pyrophosphokinase [Candidatus Bathyarchaeota archaeon]MBT7187581.1 ribose-phosphate pyrophosphokinase [Candidatus Bathyarchaeota archaeon]MBT7913707.1 ribose-phosphate pyrophosphokinase [Candidatus Bathyarchaeota archaeon]